MLSLGLKLLVNNLDRLVFTLAGVLAVYYLPLWCVVVVAIVGMFLFSTYWELAAVMFFIELVFTPPAPTWSPWYFFYTVLILLSLASIETLKRYVRL